MGFFSRFKKEQKTVSNNLSTNRLFAWGGSKAGARVNETTAMQTAAVYACVRVISEAIASLPLKVYAYDGDGRSDSKSVHNHHLYKLLCHAPNPEMTSFSFREAMMANLLIYGNAYAQIIRDGSGKVTALYPLVPYKMDVWRSESGHIYYNYWLDKDEANAEKGSGKIILRKDEVLHIPGLSFNGLIGFSPIALAKNAIGMAIAAEEFGSTFFGGGATPGGLLEVPGELKEEKMDDLRQTWEAIHGGTHNSNRMAILTDGLKYHQIAIPPEQAQFLETRKFQITEIARIFRVPPHMIGDLERSTFSNVEQQSLDFVKFCINPWVTRWEQAMWQSLILLSERDTHYIKFNLDGLMRGDYETRMRGYSIGIQNGFLCPNDVRKLENMNEIPENEGGFQFMVNGNMTKLNDVGAAYRARKGLDDATNEQQLPQ
jgi:HK97 family phage portal protein